VPVVGLDGTYARFYADGIAQLFRIDYGNYFNPFDNSYVLQGNYNVAITTGTSSVSVGVPSGISATVTSPSYTFTRTQ
jgi:hypothetical protein